MKYGTKLTFRYFIVGISYFLVFQIPTSVSVSVFNIGYRFDIFGIPTHDYSMTSMRELLTNYVIQCNILWITIILFPNTKQLLNSVLIYSNPLICTQIAQKGRLKKMQDLENDGSFRRAGKCRT